jgi:long-chain acyl-CoA synthetase
MGIQVGQILRQPARGTPDRVALVERAEGARVETTYAELDAAARSVAGCLRDHHGLTPGDRVLLACANGRDFLACWFGVLYAGCTVVPTPILSAPPEVAFRVRHSRCRAVIVDGARHELARLALAEVANAAPPLLLAEDLAASGHRPLDTPADVPAEASAMVLYTSGTTGTPKGAVITHASLVAHTAALVHHTLRFGSDVRVLGVLPLTHSYGIRMTVLVPFYAGGRTVLLPRFHAERALQALAQESVTWLPAVPTMYAAWANLAPPAPSPGALRWCLSAGAPLADDVRVRAEETLGAFIRQGYGLTEATFSTLDAPPAPPTPGTVGAPVWGIEVRIADSAGDPVPTGKEGEVLVRGQNVMAGYLDDPEATAEVLQDGWLRSGDVGMLDPSGRLTIVDRIKDLIIRGGNNVYPSEVEEALAAHPSIAQVAVVGRPDAYYGEEVVAVIVPRGEPPEASALFEWSRARLARTKLPRELAVLPALPLGPSGKVLKRELRAMLMDGRLTTVRAGSLQQATR